MKKNEYFHSNERYMAEGIEQGALFLSLSLFIVFTALLLFLVK